MNTATLLLAYRRIAIVVAHVLLWTAAYTTAFLLRFEFSVPDSYVAQAIRLFPILIVLRLASFGVLQLFHGLWRYTGSRDLIGIFKGTTAATLLFLLAVTVLDERSFPRSVFAIEWLCAIMAVGGVRFGIRKLREIAVQLNAVGSKKKMIIIGAGDAGEMLLRELHKTYGARYQVVGFVDDDDKKKGAHIHGVPVIGGIDLLPELKTRLGVEEAVIAIPSASGQAMRRIVEVCGGVGITARTIPGIDQLIDGRVTLNQMRAVAIEDLLRRAPVALDTAAVGAFIERKTVLITGAGGSIGSELCRQVCRFRPSKLVLVERGENALFEINRELTAIEPDLCIEPVLADISDRARIDAVFSEHQPEVVFHAAAHKHVPVMEWNPGEAIRNNVLGTRTLADVADAHGVQRFVMISTDKAVNPTSIMGASKRAAEIYTQSLSQRSKTRFVTVRFGNVLGSSGSVVPIFQEQIRKGGPVTVTHPEMRRYFMTIPEACQLVMQAGTMGEGGEIFVLDMGEPVKIVDLARDLIKLSGMTPDEDIRIEYTGIRPGEKLFEELMVSAENVDATKHPKIFVGKLRPHEWNEVLAHIAALERLADADESDVRAGLKRMIPEFRRHGEGSGPVPALAARNDTAVTPLEKPSAEVVLLRR